jgi:hypothetical protein
VRRSAVERLVNAAISLGISSAVAMHRFWWK